MNSPYVKLPGSSRESMHTRYSGSFNSGNLRWLDRKSTRLNSSHLVISYAVFCLKKKERVFTLMGVPVIAMGGKNNAFYAYTAPIRHDFSYIVFIARDPLILRNATVAEVAAELRT